MGYVGSVIAVRANKELARVQVANIAVSSVARAEQ